MTSKALKAHWMLWWDAEMQVLLHEASRDYIYLDYIPSPGGRFDSSSKPGKQRPNSISHEARLFALAPTPSSYHGEALIHALHDSRTFISGTSLKTALFGGILAAHGVSDEIGAGETECEGDHEESQEHFCAHHLDRLALRYYCL